MELSPYINSSQPPLAAGPRSARESNLHSALLAILQSPKPLSRAEVATSVGCTRSTASKLVDQLISGRVIEEMPASTASTPGRPAVPLRLVARRFVGIGIEINVRYIAIRMVDLNGETLTEIIEEKNLAGIDPQTVLKKLDQRLIQLTDSYCNAHTQLVGATIAVPGLVDTNRKLILRAPNLNWAEISLCNQMEFCQGMDNFQILNEANTAAVASTYSRPGKPSENKNFLYISGEFGVGGALMLDHKQISGLHGWAGEFGHVCVDPAGPKCPCGSTGCLEQYLGRGALSRLAGFSQTVTMQTIREASATDPTARAAIETAGRALGKALTTIINITDVDHVIVGGTLAELIDDLRHYALDEIKNRLLSARWSLPVIEKSKEGRLAAVTGGAYLAFHDLLNNPAKYLDI
ncbi:Sugar kinase of the NBD/HSP70 family, may contain an N-terminal HTH domain [Arcanobacterium phocae]|uniref:Sugar kinase of the NBD/HSP70 family, may contain an N-terminal HTH domain n=1 Tax=Arcanobacterium phocae TaxID=131112 RepID=A0A1H2LEW0_9ACTO|nr:ROK family protein [Arcanobacterium phocae]SDU79560.1 Sugar kinase of the NBD/HSP70 family, may contain an N-terminal HTH domain [Arcanobacterium phocae]